ncbi:hypothetical protein ACU3L3_12840 [Priestia endophytica]|nr:hypothetical protein [Priestia endophytica]KYG26176.1 hypothetical protein AZF06_16720 [Priestia endophytica]MBG9813799.1 hypothetical protein [Priestia endophytica]
MRYYVMEEDEFDSLSSEEMIYVFEHERKNTGGEIRSLEDFTGKCLFIELRNHYMYQKDAVEDIDVFELEEKLKEELLPLQEVTDDELLQLKEEFSEQIKPFIFPNNIIRRAYAYEPDWNDRFFVAETEEKYFGLYWCTTA